MNVLNIFLEEDGSVRHFTPDFKITKGSYGNNLINIMVPHNLLVDPVNDKDTESNVTGNVITIGAVVRTSMGKNLITKKYKMKKIKTFTHNATEYAQYQRIMPKPFTLWVTTTNEDIASAAGLDMIINIVNWTKNSVGAKIEEIVASPVLRLDVYPSEHLEDEDMEDPNDMDLLHSQVQEIESKVNSMNFDLYGTAEDNLGEYLSKRLKAGRKIKITKDTSKSPNNQIEISAEEIRANEVPIAPIRDMKAEDVQEALEELSKRTDSQSVDTVRGVEEGMVDNSDPRNPIICHDNSKVDKESIVDNLETEDAKKVLSANQGVIIKRLLEGIAKNLADEANTRKETDDSLQSQVDTLEIKKADKESVTSEIAAAISAVINSAPEAFDTLKEIADWIAKDEVGTAALINRVSAIETKNSEQDNKILEEETARTIKDIELQNEIDKTLRFTEQKLSEEQKEQARRNLGVDKSGSTVDYGIVTNKPELDTTSTEGLTPILEEIKNTIKLHKLSKTGAWQDVVGLVEKLSEYLKLSGGTMTGLLNAHGGISLNANTPEETGDMQFMLGIERFDAGGKVKWKRASDVKVGSATNAATLNGETKTEILQTGFINAAAAGAGQSGYIGIVRLTIKNSYVNSPTEFKIIQRGVRSSVTVSITFTNANNTDPALARAIYSGNSNLNAFIRKESPSTWVVYVQKSEMYDGIEVIDVAKGNTSNIQVDLIDTFLSSKPSDVKDLERISIANYDEDLNNIKNTYLKTSTASNTYLKKAGDRGLELWGITENNREWNSANPKILFGNAENGQNVGFIYNDFDDQIAPAGISLRGKQGNEYFDAPRIFANVIRGDSTIAGFRPSSGNELNFSSNDEHFYIGYENRVPVLPKEADNSKRVTDYHFGTHSGAEGKDKGNIHAGQFFQNGNNVIDKSNGRFKVGEYYVYNSGTVLTIALPYPLSNYDYEIDFIVYHYSGSDWVAMELLKSDKTMVQGTCTNLSLRGEANGINKAGTVSCWCSRLDNQARCWISDNTNNAVWGTVKLRQMASEDTAVVMESSGNCCFGGSDNNKIYRTSTIVWQGNDTNIGASTKYIRFVNGSSGLSEKTNIVVYATRRDK